MHFILSLLAIVLSFLLIVGVHEAGHAWVARLFGVRVTKISIGFGRPLFCRRKGETDWVWGIWPLGGSVHLLNSRTESVCPVDYPHCFDKKPIGIRCLILLSGGLANVSMAFIALLLAFMIGRMQTTPIIAEVSVPSIAASAGLSSGDRILFFADEPMGSWQDVGMRLIMVFGQDGIPLVVENKEGATRQITLNLHQWRYQRGDRSLLEAIGLTPDKTAQAHERVPGLPFPAAVLQAGFKLYHLIVFFLVVLKQVLTGVIPFLLLSGPVGLFMEMVHSFFQGAGFFLLFLANVSVAVALVNLFPIPGLDGGSILFALLEKVRGKPVSIAWEVLLYRLAVIGFFLLLVQLVLNDAKRYVLTLDNTTGKKTPVVLSQK